MIEIRKNLMHYRKVNLNDKKVTEKLYKEELLRYYEQELISDDPVFSYISFYHIIEYFYENIKVKNLIGVLETYYKTN